MLFQIGSEEVEDDFYEDDDENLDLLEVIRDDAVERAVALMLVDGISHEQICENLGLEHSQVNLIADQIVDQVATEYLKVLRGSIRS